MLKKIYTLLSVEERKECLGVGLAVFVRALLDFASLAALLPILILLLGDQPDKAKALLLCLAVLVFILLKNGLSLLITRYQVRFLLQLYRRFSHHMYKNYYRRGLLYIKSRGTISLTNEVNFICYAFCLNILQPIIAMLGSGLLVLLLWLALVVWEPLAGLLLAVGFLPIGWIYLHFIRQRARQYGEEEIQARRNQARTVSETFRGYSELEINQAYPMLEQSFLEGIESINHSRMRMQMVQSVPPIISEASIVIGIALVLIASSGDIKIVSGIFALAAFRMMPAVRGLLSSWTTIRSYSHCIDIIADGTKDKEKEEASVIPVNFAHEISIEHLQFTFPDGGEILRNLSFKIQKGERIGIRGSSGSGKSTLFNLLLGFYPLTGGEIRIDGQLMRPDMLSGWHKLIGYVPQEVFIVKGDLAQNVALGQIKIDEDRVNQVLEQVQLKSWVDTLPQGIHTPLGEFGSRLSGGQKQRIGIARALYKQAEILFFDEATSSLDSQTEKEVNEAIMQLSENHQELTLVVIAHRESTLAFCQRIIDLDQVQ